MFLCAGLSSQRPMPDKLGAVGLVVALLSLLGWWPATVARRKNLGLTGIKLWAYVTFVPVVSWVDIVLRQSQNGTDNAKSLEKNLTQANSKPESYFKKYQEQWEIWEMEHDKPEQKKRWQKALTECSLVKIIDENNGIASIAGNRGGEYITTLSVCNCSDFAKRHKPCKHMYFLANYLGVFDISNILKII